MNIYLYARISRDDGDNEISDSIVNQFSILDDFISRKWEFLGAKIIKLYDENFSGINLKRPAMQELLTAVRTRKADVIIVKDLSRISREHLDLCTLVDKIFPFMDTRVIAVSDGYDSKDREGEPLELSVAFRAILNEFHIIETSEKINRVFEQKMKNGEFTSGSLPFGYCWKSKGVPKIISEKADVVRKIFDLRLAGKTTKEIAEQLNSEKIPVPKPSKNKLSLWRCDTVSNILQNRAYAGDLVYRKVVHDLKTKKARFTSEDEQTVAADVFPPIIEREIFEKVKLTFENFPSKPFQISKNTVMVKKLYCSNCGYTLRKNHKGYYCKKSEQHGGEKCFEGRVYEKVLFPIILAKIKEVIGAYLEANKPKKVVSEKTKLTRKIGVINVKLRELFDKFADEKISETEYLTEKKCLNFELSETQNRLNELGILEALKDKSLSDESPIEKLKRLYTAENLTREHMDFVKKVVFTDKDNFEIFMDERDPLTIISFGQSIYNGSGFSENF